MPNEVLRCPMKWDGLSAIEFVNRCHEATATEEVTLDFSDVEFVKPFGTLIIANAIRHLVAQRRASATTTRALIPKAEGSSLSYLRHIGFFQYIGLGTGKQPGEARGGTTYVPVRVITLEEITGAAHGRVFQHGVEAVTTQLAEVVYPYVTEEIMMQYCLREVVRNVFEHANTDRCTVVAQRYSNGWAEVAIADEGIGIYGSLQGNLTVQSVDDALTMAIKPGISRVTQPQNRGEWENSGFGLFVLSELGRELGEFVLTSNGRYLRLSRSNSTPECGSVQVQGTAVKLLIDLEGAEYFPNRLHQLVSRGEQAYYGTTGSVKTASTRSRSIGNRPS